jgi:hypothetical protein
MVLQQVDIHPMEYYHTPIKSSLTKKKLTNKELKIMGIVLISITSICSIGLIIYCIKVYKLYSNSEKIPLNIKVLICASIFYTLVSLICGGILLNYKKHNIQWILQSLV